MGGVSPFFLSFPFGVWIKKRRFVAIFIQNHQATERNKHGKGQDDVCLLGVWAGVGEVDRQVSGLRTVEHVRWFVSADWPMLLYIRCGRIFRRSTCPSQTKKRKSLWLPIPFPFQNKRSMTCPPDWQVPAMSTVSSTVSWRRGAWSNSKTISDKS